MANKMLPGVQEPWRHVVAMYNPANFFISIAFQKTAACVFERDLAM